MGRRPHTLQGTAVLRTNAPPDAHIDAWETAHRRLHHAATVTGVIIGEPETQTVPIPGRQSGLTMIVMTAPILTTGNGPTQDTQDTPAQAVDPKTQPRQADH